MLLLLLVERCSFNLVIVYVHQSSFHLGGIKCIFEI